MLDEIHNKLVKNKWPNVNKSKSNLFCHIRRNELDSLNYSYKSKLPNGFSEYINKKIVLLINKLKAYDAH